MIVNYKPSVPNTYSPQLFDKTAWSEFYYGGPYEYKPKQTPSTVEVPYIESLYERDGCTRIIKQSNSQNKTSANLNIESSLFDSINLYFNIYSNFDSSNISEGRILLLSSNTTAFENKVLIESNQSPTMVSLFKQPTSYERLAFKIKLNKDAIEFATDFSDDPQTDSIQCKYDPNYVYHLNVIGSPFANNT